MANEEPLADTPGSEKERRRSQRVLIIIPVEARWTSSGNEEFKQHAEAEVISTHGALLRIRIPSPMPIQFQLHCPQTGQSALARVLYIAGPAKDGLLRLGVELDRASETFWGISIPPPDLDANEDG